MKDALKSWLFFLLKLVVSVGLIWLLFSTRDLDSITDTLTRVSLPILILALAVLFLSHLLGIGQWRLFLKGAHIPLSFPRAMVYYYTGLFFNNFLFSSIGGDAIRVFDVTRGEKKQTGKVVACILMDRVFGLASLVLIGNLALLLFLLSGGVPGSVLLLAYLFIDGGGIFAALCFISRRFRFFLYFMAKKLLGRQFRHGVFHFLQAISAYRVGWRLFLRALPWGLSNQLVKTGTALLIALALDHGNLSINPLYCFLFVPVLGIVKTLPLSIMGFGPHEFTGEHLFSRADIAGEWSIPFLLLAQFLAMATHLLGGVFFLFRRKHDKDVSSSSS